MEIRELIKECHRNSKEKGFWQENIELLKSNLEVNKMSFIMSKELLLIISEIGEALEALRNNKLTENINNFYDFESEIKDTFEDELADVCIRIFDICGFFGIDLQKHIELKMDYNSKRGYLHNKLF